MTARWHRRTIRLTARRGMETCRPSAPSTMRRFWADVDTGAVAGRRNHLSGSDDLMSWRGSTGGKRWRSPPQAAEALIEAGHMAVFSWLSLSPLGVRGRRGSSRASSRSAHGPQMTMSAGARSRSPRRLWPGRRRSGARLARSGTGRPLTCRGCGYAVAPWRDAAAGQ